METGSVLPKILVVAAIMVGFAMVQSSRVKKAERIELLCYDVGLLRASSLEDALADNDIANREAVLGLVLDDMDGRSLSELGDAMNRMCYELGAQHL
jgi:hypothetical protein